MSVSTTFDLLLRGGRVIDPASGIDGMKDVAIRNGKIAAVQADILPTSAREVVDVTGVVEIGNGAQIRVTSPDQLSIAPQ